MSITLPVAGSIHPGRAARARRARDAFLQRLALQPHIKLIEGQQWQGYAKPLQLRCLKHDHAYSVRPDKFCRTRVAQSYGTGCRRCKEEIISTHHRSLSDRHVGKTFSNSMRVDALDYRTVTNRSMKDGTVQRAFASGKCLSCGGNFTGIKLNHIVSGNTQSCGCLPTGPHLAKVFNPKTADVPSLVYIFHPLGVDFLGIKIGISQQKGEKSRLSRHQMDGWEHRLLCTWAAAWVIEQIILKEFRQKRTFLRYRENISDSPIITSLKHSHEIGDRDGLEVYYMNGLSEILMGISPRVIIGRMTQLHELCQRFDPIRVLKTFLPAIVIPKSLGEVKAIPLHQTIN